MKRFLKAAFSVTLFQIFVIAFFSALKYVLVASKVTDKIIMPLICVCFGAALLYVSTLTVINLIDREANPFEGLKLKSPKSRKEKLLSFYTTWGIAGPILLAYVLFLYIMAPTSWSLAIAIYTGLVIRNIVDFLSKKEPTTNQETN